MTSKTSRITSQAIANWHWAMVSLGCLTGCSTLHEASETASQPIRKTGNTVARSAERLGDRVGDSLERARLSTFQPDKSNDGPIPQNVAIDKVPTYPRSLVRSTPLAAPSRISNIASVTTPPVPPVQRAVNPVVEILPAPPAIESAAVTPQANRVTPTASESDSSSDAVTGLFAPRTTAQPSTLSNQIASSSLPLIPFPTSAAPATTPPAPQPTSLPTAIQPTAAVSSASNEVHWVRIRVRNVGTQPATQVAVSVISPTNIKLIPSDGGELPAKSPHRIDFARLEQVASGEEINAIVGLPSVDARSNRLRVQVRDGQGGTNRDVQARWQVSIEATGN